MKFLIVEIEYYLDKIDFFVVLYMSFSFYNIVLFFRVEGILLI